MRHQVLEGTLCCFFVLVVRVLVTLQLLAHSYDRLLCFLLQLTHVCQVRVCLRRTSFLLDDELDIHRRSLFMLSELVDLPLQIDVALVFLKREWNLIWTVP